MWVYALALALPLLWMAYNWITGRDYVMPQPADSGSIMQTLRDAAIDHPFYLTLRKGPWWLPYWMSPPLLVVNHPGMAMDFLDDKCSVGEGPDIHLKEKGWDTQRSYMVNKLFGADTGAYEIVCSLTGRVMEHLSTREDPSSPINLYEDHLVPLARDIIFRLVCGKEYELEEDLRMLSRMLSGGISSEDPPGENSEEWVRARGRIATQEKLPIPFVSGGHEPPDNILREVLQSVSTGTETLAREMAYAARVLAENPEIQERARQEVDELFTSGLPDPRISLPYLGAVLEEIVRLRPISHLIFRRLTSPVIIRGGDKDHSLPVDTLVVINVIGMSRSPHVWEDPGSFLPERWMGRGMYPCPSHKFVLSVMKAFFSSLIGEFVLRPDPAHSISADDDYPGRILCLPRCPSSTID